MDQDLLILSSWQKLKYWASTSSPHSSRVIENSEVFDKNGSSFGRISAVDFYQNQTFCQNVLIWFELMSQTIYSSIIDMKDKNIYLRETTKLLPMNFKSHIRLAVDFVDKNIYLSLFEFSRIDVFEIENKNLKTFLTNITKPVDIAIDSDQKILFWIENWSCLSQMYINDTQPLRMCSINARALAVDPPKGLLFWSDSNGNVFQQKYFEVRPQMIFSAKKMQQNSAIDVTNGAIYLSDSYKLLAFNRSTFTQKVVLIESAGISDFKVIESKQLCESVDHQNLNYNTSGSDETIVFNVITMSPKNSSLISDSKNNSNYIQNTLFGSNNFVYTLIVFVLIVLTTILSIFIAFKKYYKKNNSKVTKIKRISRRKSGKFLFNDENRLLKSDKNIGKTVCIEDLGSFSNNLYLDPQTFCSNCPIRQTCSSCDDKEECLERGICLTTYKLLT